MARIFKIPPSQFLTYMIEASFLPNSKPLPHLAQLFHVSAVLLGAWLFSKAVDEKLIREGGLEVTGGLSKVLILSEGIFPVTGLCCFITVLK